MAAARPTTWKDLVGPLAGAGLGLLILALTFQIRDAGSGPYGPRFWPQLIGVLMLAFNAWVVVRTIMGRAEPVEEGVDAPMTTLDLRTAGLRHWLTALLVLGFPLVIYMLGFLVGSAVFLAAFMVGLGYKRWPVVTITALVFSVSLTWFFTAGVFTPLPPGKGVFYAASAEFSRLVTGKK